MKNRTLYQIIPSFDKDKDAVMYGISKYRIDDFFRKLQYRFFGAKSFNNSLWWFAFTSSRFETPEAAIEYIKQLRIEDKRAADAVAKAGPVWLDLEDE